MGFLSPVKQGIASGVLFIALLAGWAWFFPARAIEGFSPRLLHDVAQAGVGLLIAYSVAVVNASPTLGEKLPRDRHERWIGSVAGIGLCGLTGIALGLCLGQNAHAKDVDDFRAIWVVCSIGMLGVVVALLPIASYEWRKREEADPG